MNTGIIIQARLSSTRLPQKINLPIANDGTKLLEYVVYRLSKLELPIVVAMPESQESKDFAASWNQSKFPVHFSFGSEQDVLSRFVKAIETFQFDYVVRVCSDNPFLSIDYLQTILSHTNGQHDYISYYEGETPAIRTHSGFFVEVIKASVLTGLLEKGITTYDREHVTPYIYTHEQDYNIYKLPIDQQVSELSLRLTVDTEADLQIIKKIYHSGIDLFDTQAILAYVKVQGLEDQMQQNILSNQK